MMVLHLAIILLIATEVEAIADIIKEKAGQIKDVITGESNHLISRGVTKF